MFSSFESRGLHEPYEFGSFNAKAVKEFRGHWGPWAKKTCEHALDTSGSLHADWVTSEVGKYSKLAGGGESEDSEPQPNIVPASDRLLLKDAKGLYSLPPVPSALKADLAKALHGFVSQKWSGWAAFIRIPF